MSNPGAEMMIYPPSHSGVDDEADGGSALVPYDEDYGEEMHSDVQDMQDFSPRRHEQDLHFSSQGEHDSHDLGLPIFGSDTLTKMYKITVSTGEKGMKSWMVKCILIGEKRQSPELTLQKHEDGKRLTEFRAHGSAEFIFVLPDLGRLKKMILRIQQPNLKELADSLHSDMNMKKRVSAEPSRESEVNTLSQPKGHLSNGHTAVHEHVGQAAMHEGDLPAPPQWFIKDIMVREELQSRTRISVAHLPRIAQDTLFVLMRLIGRQENGASIVNRIEVDASPHGIHASTKLALLPEPFVGPTAWSDHILQTAHEQSDGGLLVDSIRLTEAPQLAPVPMPARSKLEEAEIHEATVKGFQDQLNACYEKGKAVSDKLKRRSKLEKKLRESYKANELPEARQGKERELEIVKKELEKLTEEHERMLKKMGKSAWQLNGLAFYESSTIQWLITGLIMINFFMDVFGATSWVRDDKTCKDIFDICDIVIIALFTVELAANILLHGLSLFVRKAWNIFDFAVVLVCWIAYVSETSIQSLRTFRVLRTLKLIRTAPRLKRVAEALMMSLQNIFWILVLLIIFMSIYAIVGLDSFGEAEPAGKENFGSLSKSMLTLAQVLTMESWSSGVARPIADLFPNTPFLVYFYFISFILLCNLIFLNLIIAIIISSMDDIEEKYIKPEEKKRNQDNKIMREMIIRDLTDVNRELYLMHAAVKRQSKLIDEAVETLNPSQHKAAEGSGQTKAGGFEHFLNLFSLKKFSSK
jgi:voltage-gated sodium channel